MRAPYRRSSTPEIGAGLHLLLLVFAIFSTACQGGDNADATRIVSDSAGIEIVSIRPPEKAIAAVPTVETEPQLSIGVVSGASSHELSDVLGAIRLRDGRIVVGNGGTNELRFFGEGGQHLFSVGGDGEGPGEFRSIDFIGLIGSDTIVVHDRRLQRLTLFGVMGGFLGSHGPIVRSDMPFPNVAGVLSSGDCVTWAFVGSDDESVGVHAATARFGTFAMRSEVFHEAGTVLSGEEARVRYQGRVTRAFRPFGREGDIAAGGHQFYVLTSTDDSNVRVYDSAGKLVRILRIDIPRQRVDDAAVAAWADSWIARFFDGSPEREDYFRHGFRETPPPEYVPVFRSLGVDNGGNVCAERYPLTMDAETVYWCFSPEGHFLRSIRLPRRLLRGIHTHFDSQLEIAEDYVLGVWQDENDVQYVRMYSLMR